LTPLICLQSPLAHPKYYLNLVELFLENGAMVFVADEGGRTPLSMSLRLKDAFSVHYPVFEPELDLSPIDQCIELLKKAEASSSDE